MKTWSISDYYNFSEEFNRIGNSAQYCTLWINALFKDNESSKITFKTDWMYSDIVDYQDLLKIKTNFNTLLELAKSNFKIRIGNFILYRSWDVFQANELETAIEYLNEFVINYQFREHHCSTLTTCGNDIRIVG